jgi:hypothetical protein
MKNIEIKLFGAFRKYVPAGKLFLQLEGPSTVRMLKEQIQRQILAQSSDFKGQNLVFESALATESAILSEEEFVRDTSSLALLPPVCGG